MDQVFQRNQDGNEESHLAGKAPDGPVHHCRHSVRDIGFIPDRCGRLRIQWPLQIISTRCGLKGERLCRIWKLKTRK